MQIYNRSIDRDSHGKLKIVIKFVEGRCEDELKKQLKMKIEDAEHIK